MSVSGGTLAPMPSTPDYELERVRRLLPTKHPDRTIGAARDYYAKQIYGKGARCPCCRRSGKINAHNMTAHLVRILIWMLNESGHKRKWIDMPNTTPSWIKGSNQYSKLAYWGFVEKRGDRGKKTKHSGFWRPTKKGYRLIVADGVVPKSAFVYDTEVVGFSVEMVRCSEVRSFNYWEQIEETWMAEAARRNA